MGRGKKEGKKDAQKVLSQCNNYDQDFHFLPQNPRTPEGFQKGFLKGSLKGFRRVSGGF